MKARAALLADGDAPPGPTGRGIVGVSVAAPTVGARPDQAVAIALLVVEEIGEDRSGEARIVQLEAEIVAALVGALGPGGADLNPADIDAVAGAVLTGAVGLGDNPDVLGLEREVTISPVNSLLPVFLKVPMVAMEVLLDLCFPSPHLAASMVIDRPEAIDGAPRRGSTAKEELSCLARGMTAQPAGEESCDAAVAP